MSELKIGSHVSLSAPDYLLGSIKEAISYGSNACMVYSGAPQNTKRVAIEKFKIEEAKEYMKKHNFSNENVIMHAPYIINLGNSVKEETYELAVSFLEVEIQRARAMGVKYIVLHPGAHVKAGVEKALAKIIEGLNIVLKDCDDIVIALETMAGKGSEVGRNFEEIAYIINHVEKPQQLGVCLDTCHIHDAGYDLNDFDFILDEFDRIIGLEKLVVLHINDSKNVQGAQKDRHENIGFGHIGFDNLLKVIYHPKLMHLVKILETPYVDKVPPYKLEIEMIKNKQFDDSLKEKLSDLSQ